MRPSRGSLARLGVIVVVAALVVAGSSIGPLLGTTGIDQPEYDEYDVSELVPDRAPSDGRIQVDRAPDRGTVLIDNGHANRYRPDELQPIVGAITAAGYSVEFLSATENLAAELSAADAFVVIDPGRGFDDGEVDRIESFVESGGRLAMFGEPTQASVSGVGLGGIQLTTQRNQLGSLATAFGIDFGEGYLYNMADNDGNHRNVFGVPRSGGTLLLGVDRVATYTATDVAVSDGRRLIAASDGTRNARGDTGGSYGLAVRTGNVVAMGDSTFLKSGRFTVVDNERLIANLVSFLMAADPDRTLEDYPSIIDPAPTIRYTKVDLLRAAQTIASDLRASGRNPTVRLRRTGAPTNDTDVLVTTFGHLQGEPHDGLEITAKRGRVRVPGYESNATGLIVIRAPGDDVDVDLVVAADTAGRASRAASMLVDGEFRDALIGQDTVVLRTPDSDDEPPP